MARYGAVGEPAHLADRETEVGPRHGSSPLGQPARERAQPVLAAGDGRGQVRITDRGPFIDGRIQVPEQRIGVEDALRAYTLGGAHASFEEQEKGTLEPGKLADLVLIDRDLTRVPPETIRDAKVMLTVVGGQAVFER